MSITIANSSDLDITWSTSSYSGGNNNCVQTAALPEGTAVRDSKAADGAALVFGPAAWGGLLKAIRHGDM